MIITEIKSSTGRYSYQIQGELPQSIPNIAEALRHTKEEKNEAYKNFILDKELTEEFRPNSKSKVARDAIADFAMKEYRHYSARSVVNQYVGPLMEKYGEKSKDYIWVNYNTYQPMSPEEIVELKYIFKNFQMSEEEMQCAWIKQNQGQDVSEEKNHFNAAITFFKERYGYRPILVAKWRLKQK